jgi:hypothetical protein
VKVLAYDPGNKKLYSMGMEVADPSTFAVLKFSAGQ